MKNKNLQDFLKQFPDDYPVYMVFQDRPTIGGIPSWLHTGISQAGIRKGNGGITYIYLQEGFCK